MGAGRPRFFRRCPVGTVLDDRLVRDALVAFGAVKRWQKWPPGRDDPRLLDALNVIQREHDLLDAELLKPKK